MSKTLYQVFKNLAWPDLCQAALVCKAWREVRVVYSFRFCAETQIGTIVVMVASFPPALFFSFQAAEDPTLWKDFPVLTRMTLANFLGFIRTSRSTIWPFTRRRICIPFFLLLPLILISKFYSPVHTSGVLWLRDSRSTCRAATSQTVSSTLATLGLFCKRS